MTSWNEICARQAPGNQYFNSVSEIDFFAKAPRALIVKITKDLALQIIALNSKNRQFKPRSAYYKALVSAFANNKIRLNGETIKISKTGVLLDGQHRIHACIDTDVCFVSTVVIGLDDDVYDTIDIGKKKSPGDALYMQKEKDCHALAATLRILHEYEQTGIFRISSRAYNMSVVETLKNHQLARKGVIYGGRFYSVFRVCKPAIAAMATHILENEPYKIDHFFTSLLSGENLHAEHPVFLLRKRLFDNLARKAKLQPIDISALFIKAYNYFALDMPIKTLRWRTEGANPERYPKFHFDENDQPCQNT